MCNSTRTTSLTGFDQLPQQQSRADFYKISKSHVGTQKPSKTPTCRHFYKLLIINEKSLKLEFPNRKNTDLIMLKNGCRQNALLDNWHSMSYKATVS